MTGPVTQALPRSPRGWAIVSLVVTIVAVLPTFAVLAMSALVDPTMGLFLIGTLVIAIIGALLAALIGAGGIVTAARQRAGYILPVLATAVAVAVGITFYLWALR